MKYFLHDSSSFEDEKISMLFMEHGYEGLGLFYTILEKLAKQEKPINTKVLKMQLKVGKKLERCWQFMEEIEILYSNNGETFNKRLLKFGESMDKKRENTSKRVSQHRENQKDGESVTRYNDDCNAPNLTKHNITKDNNIIDDESSGDIDQISQPVLPEEKPVKTINISFEVFWDLYGKKDDRAKSEKKWKSLSDRERDLIIADIPKYLKTVSERKYQKNPMTYLNGKCWLDEREPEKPVIPVDQPRKVWSLNDKYGT